MSVVAVTVLWYLGPESSVTLAMVLALALTLVLALVLAPALPVKLASLR
jgi:hypothetical protein